VDDIDAADPAQGAGKSWPLSSFSSKTGETLTRSESKANGSVAFVFIAFFLPFLFFLVLLFRLVGGSSAQS